MSEPLTIDQAIDLRSQAIAQEREPAPPPNLPETETVADTVANQQEGDTIEPVADVQTEAEAVEGQGDNEADSEAEAEETQSVAAPQWWDKEAQAHFAALTPEAQSIVLDQENKREAVTQKVKAEANEAKTNAKALAERASRLAQELSAFRPSEISDYEQEYGNIDWSNEAHFREWQESDPADFSKWLAKYQFDTMRYNQAKASTAEVEKITQEQFINEQREQLKELAPELAGNAESLTAVGNYIVSQGFDPEVIRTVSAKELTMAHKAMMYDKMVAAAKSKPSQPPQKQSSPVRVPPVGSAPTRNGAVTKQKETNAALRAIKPNDIHSAVDALLVQRKNGNGRSR